MGLSCYNDKEGVRGVLLIRLLRSVVQGFDTFVQGKNCKYSDAGGVV